MVFTVLFNFHRAQLQETCQLLDNERRQHRELRRTWQQANDQFLQSQVSSLP